MCKYCGGNCSLVFHVQTKQFSPFYNETITWHPCAYAASSSQRVWFPNNKKNNQCGCLRLSSNSSDCNYKVINNRIKYIIYNIKAGKPCAYVSSPRRKRFYSWSNNPYFLITLVKRYNNEFIIPNTFLASFSGI